MKNRDAGCFLQPVFLYIVGGDWMYNGKNDYKQITINTNNKSLIAASDLLSLADINKDKNPAGIHAGYSRIVLTINQFANKSESTPSSILSFYLKPRDIRYISDELKNWVSGTAFKEQWYGKRNGVARALSISYESGMGKTPWKFVISQGTYKGEENPKYDKTVQKFLTLKEFKLFLIDIITYLNNWETIIGASLIKEIHARKYADESDSASGSVIYSDDELM